jgi:hypothetical protein
MGGAQYDGYIAKYIYKSINVFGVNDDLYGSDASRRISVKASKLGISQFQKLGDPPTTLYRELRPRSKAMSLSVYPSRFS